MGHIPAAITRQLVTLDLLVLEFNYDRSMLENGPYPYRLKQRVRGPYGHLSNDQAAQLIREFGTHRLQHVVLAHMSQDNNTIDKAYLACQQALSDAGLKQVQIHVADQVNPLNPIGLPAHYTINRPKTSPKPKLSTHSATNQPTLFPEL